MVIRPRGKNSILVVLQIYSTINKTRKLKLSSKLRYEDSRKIEDEIQYDENGDPVDGKTTLFSSSTKLK
jgi:hypothetical protein